MGQCRIRACLPGGIRWNDKSMVARAGPLATASREPRQARKGAAVAVNPCAGVWLVRVASSMPPLTPQWC